MKAAFVDVDGTLTNGLSAWERVHHHFDVVEEMKKNTDLFYSGEINYDEWAQIDALLWKGKPYSELIKSLSDITLIDGAKHGIQTLKAKGYDVVLISGGIDVMAQKVADAVGADLAISNSLGHKDGLLDGTVTIKVSFSKAEVVNKIAVDRNYDLTKCIAIGDHTNDIEMFQQVGKSLAINSKNKSVDDAATYSIQTENFAEAMTFFLSQNDSE
jgi:phosphoserine phosphatase